MRDVTKNTKLQNAMSQASLILFVLCIIVMRIYNGNDMLVFNVYFWLTFAVIFTYFVGDWAILKIEKKILPLLKRRE